MSNEHRVSVDSSNPIPMPAAVSRLLGDLYGRSNTRLFKPLTKENPTGLGLHELLHKDASTVLRSVDTLSASSGEQSHPFDFAMAKRLYQSDVHHAACVAAKTTSLVGLGNLDSQKEHQKRSVEAATPGTPEPSRKIFQKSKVDIALDPLTRFGWQDVLGATAEDIASLENGAIEVRRKKGTNEIVGIFQMPVERVWFVEEPSGGYHFRVSRHGGTDIRIASFGDYESALRRSGSLLQATEDSSGVPVVMSGDLETGFVESPGTHYSEIIYFRVPSGQDLWYGVPAWLSSTPQIELGQMTTQFQFDHYQNRGVPEFILFLSGVKYSPTEWTAIEKQLQNHIGLGKSHKTLALQTQSTEAKLQIEKLGMVASNEDGSETILAATASRIVTSHRVPPILAGIQIPGKMGATNEAAMSLSLFQILWTGPVQARIQSRLGETLGAKESKLGLGIEDFALAKITEEIPLINMDTVSRMRQSPQQASAEGRDPGKGLKE